MNGVKKMKEKLQFNKNGKFKILVFGDMHVKHTLDTPLLQAKENDSRKFMERAVDKLSPDLVILMGDNFSADSKEEYREVFLRATEPIRKRQIPLAYVNGNHDHDLTGRVSVEEIQEVFSEYDKCVAFDDTPDIDNSTNYYRKIYSSDGRKPLFNLWFIDSNNLCEDKNISNYDWVHDDQIEWYEKRALEMTKENGGVPLPSMLFQHIPVPEEYQLLRIAKKFEKPVAVQGNSFMKNNYYVLREGVKGYLGEGPCTPDYNNGQFDSWKKTGDVIAAFFGHDHMNDFEGEVDGILLAQNKLSGFFPYTDGCRCSVRQIVLNEEHPKDYKTSLFRFKEFLLKSESLGPIESRITDRQSVNLTKIRNGAIVLGATALAVIATKGYKKKGKK